MKNTLHYGLNSRSEPFDYDEAKHLRKFIKTEEELNEKLMERIENSRKSIQKAKEKLRKMGARDV